MRGITCVAAAVCCMSSPTFAQSSASASLPSPQEVAERDMLTVGVGAAIEPDYEGSNDYRLIPAVAIRGQIHGISIFSRGAYLYVNLVPGSDKVHFDAGPIVGARFNSRRHVHDDVIKLLPLRKTAIEVGGFAGVSVHGITNPYDTLAFRLDATHDINGAHESTLFSPNFEFSTPLSRRAYAGANLGLEFVGKKFADYYYAITPADSLASSLPVFNARGGLKNWKAGLLIDQSITGDLLHGISVFGAGQYSGLVGDFKRSPIVSQRGSADQWIGAVGLAYTW